MDPERILLQQQDPIKPLRIGSDGIGEGCGGTPCNVNSSGSEPMPLATTTSEYVPCGKFAGSVNSVVSTLVPVMTPVLLQLYVRA